MKVGDDYFSGRGRRFEKVAMVDGTSVTEYTGLEAFSKGLADLYKKVTTHQATNRQTSDGGAKSQDELYAVVFVSEYRYADPSHCNLCVSIRSLGEATKELHKLPPISSARDFGHTSA